MRRLLAFALFTALLAPCLSAGESTVFEKVARQKAAAPPAKQETAQQTTNQQPGAEHAAVVERPKAAPATSTETDQEEAPQDDEAEAETEMADEPIEEEPSDIEEVSDEADELELESVEEAGFEQATDAPTRYLHGNTGPEQIVIEEPFAVPEEELPPGAEMHGMGHTGHHGHPRPMMRKMCRIYEYMKRPMQGQSWLSRPMSIGFQFGGIFGGELLHNRVDQSTGELVLMSLGWDHTNYDGYEVRLGGSTIHTFNETLPLDPRDTRFGLFDSSILLYPWGDARLRPYGRFGVGLHSYYLVDDHGLGIKAFVPAGLIGFGVKFLFQRHCALRVEFLDNIGFGSGLGLDTVHNTSLMFGIEYRFGGMHKNYWPWNSGRLIW